MIELSKEKKAEEAFNLVQELILALSGASKKYLIIGRNLNELKNKKLWKYYGEHIKSFGDLLKELKFGRATAYNYMRVYNVFGKEVIARKLDVDYFRLLRLLPVVKENDKEEWLLKAANLLPQDFNNEIKKAKGGKDSNDCCHTGEVEFYIKCSKCGKLLKQTAEQIETRIIEVIGKRISEARENK